MSRMVGLVQFDAATSEEIQKVICALLTTDLTLEIEKDPRNLSPKYSRWQIILTSCSEKVEEKK